MQRNEIEIKIDEVFNLTLNKKGQENTYLGRVQELIELVNQDLSLTPINNDEKEKLSFKISYIFTMIGIYVQQLLKKSNSIKEKCDLYIYMNHAHLAYANLVTGEKDRENALTKAKEALYEAYALDKPYTVAIEAYNAAKTDEDRKEAYQLLSMVYPPKKIERQPNEAVKKSIRQNVNGFELSEVQTKYAPYTPNELYDHAVELLKINNESYEAIECFEFLLSMKPERKSYLGLAEAQFKQAHLLATFGHTDQGRNLLLIKAVSNLNEAIKLDPENSQNKKIKNRIYEIQRLMIPDNALRMIEYLDNYQRKYGSFSSKSYNKFKDYLHDAYYKVKDPEKIADVVYKTIEMNPDLPEKFKEKLKLASLTNKKLLEAAESAITHKEKENHYREVAGRLLRDDKLPNAKLGIETMLEKKKKPEMEYKYLNTLRAVENNFFQETKKLTNACQTYNHKDSGNKEPAVDLVKKAEDELEKDIPLSVVYQNKPIERIIVMRNNLHNYAKNHAPKLNEVLEKKKNSSGLLKAFHAAFVALGCLSIVYIPFVIRDMHHSKQTKGTVFFTHAPEERKIKHQAKKSFHALGRIKK